MNRNNLPPRALAIARYARALTMASGDRRAALAYAASQNWSDFGRIATQLKSAAAGLTTGDTANAPLAVDVAEILRPLTVIGRLQGTHVMPFHSRLLGMSAGASAAFVPTGAAIPLSAPAFSEPAALDRKKVAGLVVASDETLRDAAPQTERALTADLFAALAAAMDEAFLDPASDGTDGRPVSITYGGAATASTGGSVAQIDADLAAVIEDLIDAGSTLQSAAWIVHPRSAVYLSLLRGSGGAPAHPGISVAGGTLAGLPVLISAAMPVTADTDALTSIVLVDGDGVLIGDENEGELAISRSGMLEQDTEPTADVLTPTGATATNMTSLFQAGAAAIRAIRYVNWLPRRAVVASTLTSVGY